MLNRSAYGAFLLVVVGWMLGCGTDSIGQSIAQLQSPNAETRRAAARILGQSGASKERVVTALANSAADKDLEVRTLAIDALGRIGKPAAAALPALRGELRDIDPHGGCRRRWRFRKSTRTSATSCRC